MGARNGVFPAVSQPAKLAGAGKVRASWNRLTSGPRARTSRVFQGGVSGRLPDLS